MQSQDINFYKNAKEQSHLCGVFPIEYLENDSVYKRWFDKNYSSFSLPEKRYKWAKKLKQVNVDIYLGTWCGDSKKWVPQFVKLWDLLNLNRKQLRFIALYGGKERYKTGPNGEEKGQQIHRVPVFIFHSDGKEIARIVESPQTDLLTDVAQIALGFPSTPNYDGANSLFRLLDNVTVNDIRKSFDTHLKILKRKCTKSKELNTLGYVFLHSGDLDKALLCFDFNTRIFPYEPSVYSSYADVLAIKKQYDEAQKMYKKVLKLDSKNKHAKEQIERLKRRIQL